MAKNQCWRAPFYSVNCIYSPSGMHLGTSGGRFTKPEVPPEGPVDYRNINSFRAESVPVPAYSHGLVVDSEGNYIISYAAGQFIIFDEDFQTVGNRDTELGVNFDRLAIGPGDEIFAKGNGSVYIFDKEFTFLRSFEIKRDTGNVVIDTGDIAIDKKGHILNVDRADRSVIVYNKSGEIITRFTNGEKEPYSLCVNSQGHILVGSRHWIRVYDQDYSFLFSFKGVGSSLATDALDRVIGYGDEMKTRKWWYPSNNYDIGPGLGFYEPDGHEISIFELPRLVFNIAIDDQGRIIYLSDRLVVLTPPTIVGLPEEV